MVVPLDDEEVGSREEVLPDNKEVLPLAPPVRERVGNIELLELLSDRVPADNNEGLESAPPCVNKDDILGVNDVPIVELVLGKSDAVVVLLLGVEFDVVAVVELLAATSDELVELYICADAATANEIGDVREDELSADEDVGSIGSILIYIEGCDSKVQRIL